MTPSRHTPPRRRPGFSLIEMLFVIGIVAILVALLIPVVSQSRRQARMAVCASNLHQIYLAGQTWKQDNERQGNPNDFQATGWMETWSSFANNDRRIYNCPEDPLLQTAGDVRRGGDKAGTAATPDGSTPVTPGGSGGTGGTSGTNPTTTPPDLSDLVLRTTPNLNKPNEFYDLDMKPGPWVKKTNVNGNSYDLWAEHQFWKNGDKGFDDVGVRVTTNADGTVTVQLLSRSPDHLPYRDDVMAKGKSPGDPMRKVFNNVYGTDTKDTSSPVGSTMVLTDNANHPTDGSGGSAGSGGSTGGSGGTSTGGSTGTPGAGADASYGLNANLRRVDGNADKVFGTDYFYSVVDPAKEDWANVATDRTGRPLFARHFGYANILYGDGSVRAITPTKTNLNPAFADNRPRFWEQ